jgi:hypothetical protein
MNIVSCMSLQYVLIQDSCLRLNPRAEINKFESYQGNISGDTLAG